MPILALTTEAIPSLCNLVSPPPIDYSPVLQILMIKKITRNDNSGAVLYRLILSDGIFYCDGALGSSLNHLVEEGVLETYSNVQVEEFNVVVIEQKIVIIVKDLNVLQHSKIPFGTPSRFYSKSSQS